MGKNIKIAILTLNGYFNYGNKLQNYALQKILSIFSNNVNTLWYEEDEDIFFTNKLFLSRKELISNVLNKNKLNIFLKGFMKTAVREYNIRKFSLKYINTIYNHSPLKNKNEYDFFIVGSDQVWNPFFWSKKNNRQNILLLKGIPLNQSISYSASFGISSIPKEYESIIKDGLNGMKAISVREGAGAKIVKDLTGRNVPVLVDPTLLLSKEEWQNITLKPEWYKDEKYILTYFLGKPSSLVKDIADKYNYKIYNLMDKEDLDLYTSRVEEFVYLIEHAQLVVTDSFHACVFSILMNTPFLVVNRQQVGLVDMSSRLDTLLSLFGYQDRYLTNGKCDLSDEKILNMDFSNVKKVQEREKERSVKYLKEAMNLDS